MNIASLTSGERILGQFLLADVRKLVKDGGSNYWSLTLQDATGSIEAKKWDCLPEDDAILVKGQVIQVDGEVLKYRNALQMKVRRIEAVSQDAVDWERFVASAPMSVAEMRQKLDIVLSRIHDEDIASLTKAMIAEFLDDLLVYPGAVRNHHDYMGGLLFHTLTMADLAAKVCSIYASIDRDMVLAGVLLHDLGKTVELSGVRGTAFTTEGKLLGHISIGHAELRAKAKALGYFAIDDLSETDAALHPELAKKKEVATLLEHILLSHHGKQEFGSPVLPATREALVVSMIDDLDAKMAILDKAYKGVEPGGVTARLFNMDDRYFYKPTFAKENPEVGLNPDELRDELE